MAIVRIRRALAISRRDLRAEFKGRQGFILPGVMAMLLVPAATIPGFDASDAMQPEVYQVAGDVPPEVAALPEVRRSPRAHLRFFRREDHLEVNGLAVPGPIRDSLDAGNPAVVVETLPTGFVFPGRTALFALISASTLTGSVSASVGGERSARTLVVLLAAAVSRAEIVLGKWLAWGGLGFLTAMTAALGAVALGRVEPGWWLVPVGTVPLAAVAFGLWLVRRAGDVVAGSTTSLRVLPVLLGFTGIAAWLLGRVDEHLGALVPVGGALIAAGDTWFQPTAVVLSALATLGFCAACLWATARDLEEVPNREPPDQPLLIAMILGTLAAVTWWIPVVVPLLWAEAGNDVLTRQLPIDHGLIAGALGLFTFSLVRAGRSSAPATDLGLDTPLGWRTAAVAGLGALALLAAAQLLGPLALDGTAFGAATSDRLAHGLFPVGRHPAIVLAVIVADELLFRGWLARMVGDVRAAIVFAVVKAPLDPIGGLAVAATLGGIGRFGGVPASILARIGAIAVASWLL